MIEDSGIAIRRQLGHEPALDGIRGIAVLLVAFWHYPDAILDRKLEWMKAGHLGVDLFFVLSGFLITALMLKEFDHSSKISFRGFYRRRVFRLLPALVVFLTAHFLWALSTDLSNGLFAPGTELRDEIATIIGALLFSLNLIHLFGDYQATRGAAHLWSLAVEEQFYFIWPLLTAGLLSQARRHFFYVTAATALVVATAGYYYANGLLGLPQAQGFYSAIALGLCVFLLLALLHAQELGIRALAVLGALILAVLLYRFGVFEAGSISSIMSLYSTLPARADSLIAGAALAYLWVNDYVPRRCHTAISLIAWAIFAWCVASFTLLDSFFFEFGWTITAVCGALIIWGSLGAQDTVYGRVLSLRWLRGIGKVAYGLYLWHVLVFLAVKHWFGDESIVLKTILTVSITAGVTAASWFLVERPMLAYKSSRRPKNAISEK